MATQRNSSFCSCRLHEPTFHRQSTMKKRRFRFPMKTPINCIRKHSRFIRSEIMGKRLVKPENYAKLYEEYGIRTIDYTDPEMVGTDLNKLSRELFMMESSRGISYMQCKCLLPKWYRLGKGRCYRYLSSRVRWQSAWLRFDGQQSRCSV